MSMTIGGTSGLVFPDASSQTTAATGFGFKNRILNGQMVLDQRNAGASVTGSTSDPYITDRWKTPASQNSKFTFQQNQGSVTPPTSFTNYLGATSSSAYSVTSSDIFGIDQRIEGLNIADLGWGTASAATVTLSFWVRSSLTGTFGGSLMNSAANRSYPFSYTISVANTWEQKSVTIAGDTSGTWLTTNGIGIRLTFSLGMGSTYTGTAGSWAGATYLTATGATSVVGTNGATFYITGVQLEKGSTATSFDYRPYGTELALCQRYYQVAVYAPLGGRSNGTASVGYGCPLPVALRSSPTVTDGGTCYAFSGGARTNTTGGANSVTRYGSSSGLIYLTRNGFTGLTDDRIYNVEFSSELTLSAEL